MKRKIKIVYAVICVISIIFCTGVSAASYKRQITPPIQKGIKNDTDSQFIAQYEKIAENNILILYADMEKGWLALQNRESGTVWYSNPNDSETDEITVGNKRMDIRSDFIVEYCERKIVGEAVSMTFNSHTQAVRQGSVQVEKISDGIKVTYDFQSFGIVIPVEYRLAADHLETKVCVNEIKENGDFVILSIRVLPNFGAGNTETEGWMLIPDGSGAITRFNNARYNVNGYDAPVYGADYANEQELCQSYREQSVRLPIFGIKKGQDALFSVITGGESAAYIKAEFSNESFGYNTLSSRLVLRQFTTIDVNSMKAVRFSDNCYAYPDYTVNYYPLSGENADYVGMAKVYRQYLISERGMNKTAQRPALNLNLYGAIDVKANTLGFPHKKLESLTDFSEALKIAKDLREDGVGNLSVRYEGWTNYGIMNKSVPKNAQPLSLLGGNDGLHTLAADLEENNDRLWLDFDFLRYRKGGNGVSKGGDSIKNGFGDPTEQYDYMLSVYAAKVNGNHYRFLRAGKVEETAKRVINDFKKLDIYGLSLGTMGEYIYSDLNPKHGHDRTGLQEVYRKILNCTDGQPLSVNKGNADMAVKADKIWYAPLSSSGYDCFDYDVPFYQIVFHGSAAMTTAPLNQAVNDRLLFLNAVETGSELLFAGIYKEADFLAETAYSDLYSTTFSLWREKAAAYDKEYRPLLEQIYDKAIKGHKRITENVYQTVYENGITVYVNYGEQSATVNGIEIGGMDFETVIP